MICTTCSRQPHCLPARLAQDDDRMQQLLIQLKTCKLQETVRSPKTPRQPLHASFQRPFQRLWHQVWS